MDFDNYRPPQTHSPTDKQLSRCSWLLEQLLYKKQPGFKLLMALTKPQLHELAIMLTEFAEDTWFEIGMWESIERYNRQVFGTPLPLSLPENTEYSDFPFDEYRLIHFLQEALEILRERFQGQGF